MELMLATPTAFEPLTLETLALESLTFELSALEMPQEIEALPRSLYVAVLDKPAQAVCVPVDLYFSGMARPIRVQLSEAEVRELEITCRGFDLSSETRLYSHPFQANACAACFLP